MQIILQINTYLKNMQGANKKIQNLNSENSIKIKIDRIPRKISKSITCNSL